MDISTGAQHDSRYLPARFNEKGKRGVCLLVVWFGDAQKAFQKVISEQYQTVLMSVAMAFQ
jgi:hypothetical protein